LSAEILTIGDEVLRGEIVDSNKSFLSDRLLSLDIETRFHSSVRDDPEDIADAFRRAKERSEIVLVSGGLGPTRDDLTVEVLARTFGRELVLHEPSLEAIRAFFARFGRTMAENNEKQAWLPEGAEALPNPVGTAPGTYLRVGGTSFFCLPGVPRELMLMMNEQVLPRIAASRERDGVGGKVVRSRLLRTFGLGESNLDELLGDVAKDGDVVLGFRTAFPDNYLRPLTRGATAAEADAKLEAVVATVRERLAVMIYGEDEQTLEEVVGVELAKAGLTLAVAESCTGGLLAERITRVPGSSGWFRGGVVSYANEAKTALLGVPKEMLDAHGAVSEPVARAMAEGVRARLGADLGVSTTGIAGPDGGTADKPVGTVWIAVADADGTVAERFVFPFDRARNRQVTSQVALDWIRRSLLGETLVAPRYLRSEGGN
jgi:nicotinamide-nucleotide amidase